MKRSALKPGKPLRRTAFRSSAPSIDRALATSTTKPRRRLKPSHSEVCPAPVKAALVERDGWCLRCGCPGNVAHHIIRRPLPKAILWDLNLLALLCWECHGAVHHDAAAAKKAGLIVSRFSPDGRALLAEAMASAVRDGGGA